MHQQFERSSSSMSASQETMSTNSALIQHVKRTTSKLFLPLLVTNYLLLFVGSVSSSLLSKYYFNHKGASRWVSTLVQSAGFPTLFIPIYCPYLLKCSQRKPFSGFTRKLLGITFFMGLVLGVNNFFFSCGNSYLPMSTLSLLLSTQLMFNLIFSVMIVKQKITFSNLNCVILLTISSVLLALSSKHDKPKGLTHANYFKGFLFAIGAGLLFAITLPVLERIYQKVYCYGMVMEMQMVMQFSATVFAVIGMAADGGFQEMKIESEKIFDKGPAVYWSTVMSNVITWQFCFLGSSGMIFLTSALTSAICMTVVLTLNVLGGVLVYKDDFGGSKVVSTVLCLWAFCSYVYGMYIKMKREEQVKGDGDHQETATEMAERV